MTAVSYLPTLHKLPLYPSAHWQSKSFPALTHVPPFIHGLGSHTESAKTKQKEQNVLKEKRDHLWRCCDEVNPKHVKLEEFSSNLDHIFILRVVLH